MAEHVTKLLNGKGMAAKIRADLKRKITQSRVKPGLAVILVGHDPASQVYVKFKSEASEEIGMHLETIELPEDVPQVRLLRIISKLNRSKKIHGILVQLPLPDQLEPFQVMSAIDPRKDVDGFHPENTGWLAIGQPRMVPATTIGIWQLIQSTGVSVVGKNVVIVGKSNIVGKPTAAWLLHKGATVTVCHKSTEDLAVHTRQADILISATGVPDLITAEMVKPGAMVIDAGISKRRGRVVGDVDYEAVVEVAKYITPVPGGVGPMTVAALLQNTWLAMRRIEG